MCKNSFATFCDEDVNDIDNKSIHIMDVFSLKNT